MLNKQFFAFHCNYCSIAPLTDYANNSIFWKLQKESEYFSTSDKE